MLTATVANGRRAGAVIRKYLEFNEKIVGAAAEMKLDGDILIISGDSGWKNMDKLAAMR